MERKTVRLYLLLNGMFYGGISFIGAIYVLFLLSRGMNLLEVNLVNMAYATTMVIAELPTGLIADIWGRKFSFLIACFLHGLGMLIYAFSDSFWQFVLAESIAAIGGACATGAFQAWAIDSLHHQKHNINLKKLIAREGQIKQICCVGGTLAGGYLADVNIILPWIVGGCLFFLTGFIAALTISEDYFSRPAFEFKKHLALIKETAGASFNFCRKNKSVKLILLLGLINAAAIQAYNMQWQPFFSRYVGARSMFGWIMAGNFAFTLIGYSLAGWFAKKEKVVLPLSQFLIGFAIIMAVVSNSLGATLAFYFMHEIGRGIDRTLASACLNKEIPSKDRRATILSLGAAASHIGMIIGLAASGFLAQHFSIKTSWLASSLFLITATAYALKSWRSR